MPPGSGLKMYLYDRAILAYTGLMMVLILLLGRPWDQYRGEFVFYVTVATIVILVVHYLCEDGRRIAHGLRLLYPVLLFTFLYRATGGLMFLVHDGFLDSHLVALERSWLGTHPTILVDQYLPNLWLTEVLSLCYFSYYLMIPVFFLLVYFSKDFQISRSALSAVCLTFFASYALFFLYPIEGPRWHFAGQYVNEIDGLVFRRLVELVIANGAVRGGCMPSSHFGVAVVLCLYCARHYHRWLWLMAFLTLGLGIGAVWGRYHYVSDVVVGGVIGLVATLLVWKWEERAVAGRHRLNHPSNVKVHHVS